MAAGLVGLAVIAYFARGRQLKPKSEIGVSPVHRIGGQEATAAGTVLNLSLVRVEPQTHDAKMLRFVLPREEHLAARPGQFLTFEWMIDGKPVTRSYSICSSPTQRSFVEITAKRVENGCVSVFLNDRARLGHTVRARGPFGRFYFDETKHRRIVLIAAGSGVTPMLAILRYIDDLYLPVEVTLIYCVRTERDVFFQDEFVAMQGRMPKFRFALVLSQPSSEWTGWKGRLRQEILEREAEKPAESCFFLCGPPAFMELARALLKGVRVEPSRILQESFGGAVTRETQGMASAGSLEIRFYRSAAVYRVSPEKTLLETSEKLGVLLPSGCRQGVCGTCVTRLLSGKVKMETEEGLNEQMRSQGFILPCVSRPLSDITLDA